MDEINETGGARIGLANATWPFATLIVNTNELQLKVSILGNLMFRPSDIISIEPYSIAFKKGIKINHRVNNYNSMVIFWTREDAVDLISRIGQTGFLTNKTIPADLDNKIVTMQLSGSFPFKKSAAIILVLIWNMLFIGGFIMFFKKDPGSRQLFLGPQLALAFAIFTGLLIFMSEPFRNIVLKPNRTIGDVKVLVYFIMFICAVMFIAISLLPLKSVFR